MRKSRGDAVAVFRVHGMSIEGRARSLGLKLGRLEGVHLVDFNYIMDTVSIGYDGKKPTLDSIRSAIARASA